MWHVKHRLESRQASKVSAHEIRFVRAEDMLCASDDGSGGHATCAGSTGGHSLYAGNVGDCLLVVL
jgi:hypothetical protein